MTGLGVILSVLLSVVAFAGGYARGMDKCMPAVLSLREILKIREVGTNERVKGVIRKNFNGKGIWRI